MVRSIYLSNNNNNTRYLISSLLFLHTHANSPLSLPIPFSLLLYHLLQICNNKSYTNTIYNSYQTSNTTIYKFGIDTSNQLAYYKNDIKLWYALIPSVDVDETSNAADNNNNNNNSGGNTGGDGTNDGVGGGGMSSSFVNGGQPSSSSPSQQEEVHYFRINQSGSISAYNIDRLKIWDSHLNLGVYTPLYYSLGGGEMIEDGKGENSIVSNMVNDKISGSVLQLTEDGNVVIQSENDEDEEVVVTWSIDAPPSLEDKEVVSVSGKVFYDMNSNGLNDDSASSSSTSIEKEEVVSNVIVDLYDCSSTEVEDEWILVTRTNNLGEYKFTVPSTSSSSSSIESDGGSGGSMDTLNLSNYLMERGISKIRAVFTLSTDGGDGTVSYSFSPTSKDSDVNNIGSTSCWDLKDENDNIIWNAGIITTTSTSQEESTTPQEVETMPTTTQETTGTGIVGGYAFLDINNDGIRNNNNDPNSSSLQLEEVESSMSNVNIQLYKCTPEEEVSSSSSSFFSGGGETSSTSTTNNIDNK